MLAGALAVSLLAWPGRSNAATNEAVDPGGGSVALAPSGKVSVESLKLGLVKQARGPTGGVLPAAAPVSPGQELYFVLFVDNPTSQPARPVQITDALDETQFLYQPDSLEATTVSSGSDDAGIWAGKWTPLTDAVGPPDDVASALDTGTDGGKDRVAVGAVPGQANRELAIPAKSLWALRFRVRVR